MHGMVPPDPCGEGVSQQTFATIYMPKFKPSQKRFPASCVTPYPDERTAIEAAQGNDKCYAALLQGPSKSSEGQYIFYLLRWL